MIYYKKLRKCGFLNLLLQFGTEKERGREKNEKKKETLQKKKKKNLFGKESFE